MPGFVGTQVDAWLAEIVAGPSGDSGATSAAAVPESTGGAPEETDAVEASNTGASEEQKND